MRIPCFCEREAVIISRTTERGETVAVIVVVEEAIAAPAGAMLAGRIFWFVLLVFGSLVVGLLENKYGVISRQAEK